MEELEILFLKRDIPFNHKDNHIRCFPHVINICAQHTIDKFTSTYRREAEYDGESDDPDAVPVSSDPIARGRLVVKAIRASGQRRDRFEDLIRDGNAKGYFKVEGQIVKVNIRQLLLDVRTRWDSVYQMIKRLREMRPVSFYSYKMLMMLMRFIKQAIDFMLMLDEDMSDLRITPEEWDILRDFEVVLNVSILQLDQDELTNY